MKTNSKVYLKDFSFELCYADKIVFNRKTIFNNRRTQKIGEKIGQTEANDEYIRQNEVISKYLNKQVYTMKIKVVGLHHFELYIKGEN